MCFILLLSWLRIVPSHGTPMLSSPPLACVLRCRYRQGYALREQDSLLYLTWKGRDMLASSAWTTAG